MSPIGKNLLNVAALSAVLALAAGAAGAQQAPDAAPTEDAAAAEPAPAAPAHLEACGAARCLTVGVTPDLQQKLDAGAATLDDLAAGLTTSYEGLEPVRAYFVAARYQNDRLVRYDVSEALTIEPGAPTFPDLEEVLREALGPRTESGVMAAAVPGAISPAAPAFPDDAFVGSMPGNTLMGLVRPDLTEPLDVATRMGLGGVGVLAVITRDAALRANLESKSIGTVVRLNYSE